MIAKYEDIEVTPEMLAAGIEAVGMWDSCDLDEWKAIDIYRQMEMARLATASADAPKEESP